MKHKLCNDKVLIIGESCKDVFNYCDAKRLCPDIPVPALTVKYQKDNPGMAKDMILINNHYIYTEEQFDKEYDIEAISQSIVDRIKAEVKTYSSNKKRHKQ